MVVIFRFTISTTIILSLFLIIASCNDNTLTVIDSTGGVNIIYTAADTLESEQAALWWSAELLPPDSLSSIFLLRLNYLRVYFHDSVDISLDIDHILANRFIPPWLVGCVSLQFTDSIAQDILDHRYTGWDMLDSTLRPDSIINPIIGEPRFLLKFNKPYHPRRLTEIVRHLPGVVHATVPYLPSYPGSFHVYPGMRDGEMTFYFVENDAGYYFKYSAGRPYYLGAIRPWSSELPPWYSEAVSNAVKFMFWDGVNR